MSSSVVSSDPSTGTRRHLSERQSETVSRLATAAMQELRGTGWAGLTVRNVARRAGVAPATAYTYFASKEHLVTEVFWQRIRSLQHPSTPASASVADAVAGALAPIARMVAAEPELAAACTVAMLSEDPEVRRLRDDIGAHWSLLVRDAAGEEASDRQLLTIESAFSGLLLRAGMGHMSYDELPARMAEVAAVAFPSESPRS